MGASTTHSKSFHVEDGTMETLSKAERLSRGFEPVTRREWMMVALAALSAAMVFANTAYAAFIPDAWQRWMVPLDLAILAVFGLEFLGRLLKADGKARFVATHWYDVIGLVPVASPLFRSLRLVRLARMFVVAKLPWEQDANWMFALVRRGINLIVGILVAELIRPMMLMGIKMSRVPLRKARVAAMAGKILDAQKEGVEQVALASLKIAKPLKPVADSAAGQKLVHAVTVSVLGTVAEFLQTDEVNDLLADTLDAAMEQSVEAMSRAASPA